MPKNLGIIAFVSNSLTTFLPEKFEIKKPCIIDTQHLA